MPTDDADQLQRFLEAEIDRAMREQAPMVNLLPFGSIRADDDPRPKKIEIDDEQVMTLCDNEWVYLPTSPWVVSVMFPILEVVAAEDRGAPSPWVELEVSKKIREYETMCAECRYVSELRYISLDMEFKDGVLVGWRKLFYATAVRPGTVVMRVPKL
jgi:hypothetical protein